jgi:hypothetical protein
MTTENKAIDYQAMIADLRAKRAAIDSAITSLIAASGAMIPNGDTATSNSGYSLQSSMDSQSIELPRGAFLGKSLPAAVKLYLSAVKQKQSIKEIAAALREGGVESTSDNFEGVITGCLNRMKANGEILRFNDGWALAEFYPENLRNRLSQHGAPKRKTSKKKVKKAKKTPASPKPVSHTTDRPAIVEGLEHRLEAYLQGRLGEWVSLKEVVEAHQDVKPTVIALTLGRMTKKNGWEKSPEGKFRIGQSNVQQMSMAV